MFVSLRSQIVVSFNLSLILSIIYKDVLIKLAYTYLRKGDPVRVKEYIIDFKTLEHLSCWSFKRSSSVLEPLYWLLLILYLMSIALYGFHNIFDLLYGFKLILNNIKGLKKLSKILTDNIVNLT